MWVPKQPRVTNTASSISSLAMCQLLDYEAAMAGLVSGSGYTAAEVHECWAQYVHKARILHNVLYSTGTTKLQQTDSVFPVLDFPLNTTKRYHANYTRPDQTRPDQTIT